jgi:hypothetical protein
MAIIFKGSYFNEVTILGDTLDIDCSGFDLIINKNEFHRTFTKLLDMFPLKGRELWEVMKKKHTCETL